MSAPAHRRRRRTRRGRLRRLSALGVATLLLVGGGSALLAAALGDGPAGADATLGGFTVTSLGEAVTAQYEQPNFPLPATPSLEFDEGYATSSDNYGPTGEATASTLYPGQVVANAGPQLATLVPGAPLPPAPVWPLQAVSSYPQTPNTASTDQPGVNMDTTSSADGNTATATLGDDASTAGADGADPASTAPSSAGNPLASSSAIFGIGALSATSSSTAPTTTASAEATATVSGVSLLGGFVDIGSVTSTATATSDGTTGKVTGSTEVQNMEIAGQQVTVDADGIAAAGQSAPLSIPIASIDTLLQELGISIALTNPTDTVKGASAERVLDGLQISINLDTLDAAANRFASLLPASVTSQLPVAIPDEQEFTVDLAHVDVSSTASPPFTANSGNTGTAGTAGASSSTPPSSFATPATSAGAGTFTGDSGAGSSFTPTGTTGSGVTPAGSPGGGSPVATASAPTSTVAPASFRGIGTALVLLGLLAAAAMAYLYKRADDASELTGVACADGDPLGERFLDAGSDPSDFGGFG